MLEAGVCTSAYYPAHGATPSDWARPLPHEVMDERDMGTARTMYIIFIMYRLTGLVDMSGGFSDHVKIEKPMLAEAEATGLSAAALREIGNGHVRNKKWADASVAYSHALALALKRPESADERMEAAKAATNRSFVHSQLAKQLVATDEAAMAIEKNARVMKLVADAKERGTGGISKAPPRART
jgi:hypothetical protein